MPHYHVFKETSRGRVFKHANGSWKLATATSAMPKAYTLAGARREVTRLINSGQATEAGYLDMGKYEQWVEGARWTKHNPGGRGTRWRMEDGQIVTTDQLKRKFFGKLPTPAQRRMLGITKVTGGKKRKNPHRRDNSDRLLVLTEAEDRELSRLNREYGKARAALLKAGGKNAATRKKLYAYADKILALEQKGFKRAVKEGLETQDFTLRDLIKRGS